MHAIVYYVRFNPINALSKPFPIQQNHDSDLLFGVHLLERSFPAVAPSTVLFVSVALKMSFRLLPKGGNEVVYEFRLCLRRQNRTVECA